MNVLNVTSGFAFSRNPVILSDDRFFSDIDGLTGHFRLTMGDKDIYEGRSTLPLRIDVSEIVDAYSDFFPEPPESGGDGLSIIEDAEALSSRRVYAAFEYDSYESDTEFTVIPGGVSIQNFKQLAGSGEDVFSTRYLNPDCNFFLTTRTSGWHVILKETELYPLYFIVNDEECTLRVTESVTGQTLTYTPLDKGVYALDVEVIRMRFFDECRVLSNIFDISLEGKSSCRVIIERSACSRERYRLKFRNSLGVFEIMEISGNMEVTPDYKDNDDLIFRRYDPLTGYFHYERGRMERSQYLSVKTGVKRPDQVRHLMDMVASEEVYLIDYSRYAVRVIPSLENFSFKANPDIPEIFDLKLKVATEEMNIMQDILDGSVDHKPKIFTKQFTRQFN